MAFLQRDFDVMYRRVIAALDAELSDIPAGSAGAEAADGLRAEFAVIENKSGAQAGFQGAAQAGTEQRVVARRNLYKFRQKLADTADTIARKKPGFDENYPSPSDENDGELLAVSRAVVAQAITDEVDFTRLAVKKNDLQAGANLVAAFEASFQPTDAALASRGAAVGNKKESRRRAADFFAELDTYIENFYEDQPDKLHVWEIASHIERPAKTTKPVAPKP